MAWGGQPTLLLLLLLLLLPLLLDCRIAMPYSPSGSRKGVPSIQALKALKAETQGLVRGRRCDVPWLATAVF